MQRIVKELGRLRWEDKTYIIWEDEAGVYTMAGQERCRVRSLGRKVSMLEERGTVEVMHATRQEMLFWGRIELAGLVIE